MWERRSDLNERQQKDNIGLLSTFQPTRLSIVKLIYHQVIFRVVTGDTDPADPPAIGGLIKSV